MTREELIAALERAEGPSRELDAAIMRLLCPDTTHDQETDTWTMPFAGKPVRVRLACYTASIDAALTLAGGAAWTAEFVDDDREYRASVWDGDRWRNGHSQHNAAIALCIASLRAKNND